MKNILVISSLKKQNKSFLSLFRDLSINNSFITWTNNDFFFDNFGDDELNRKIYLGPSLLGKKFKSFVFLLLFLYIWYFLEIAFSRKKYNIGAIVCMSFAEKIIFTPIGKLFRIKIIWFDEIEIDYRKKSKLIILLLKFCSNFSKTMVFTEQREKELVEMRFKNIKNVSLGLELENPNHQDNIFSNLAKAEKRESFFKNFTIGVVTALDDRMQVEALLKAIRICSGFVSNLQLVVIGSGKEKKNFLWLARKMEIEKQVWFVGDQEYLGKWFDNFDLYVIINNSPSLFDLEVVLEAMSKKLPVIAFETNNLKELVIEDKTGIMIKEKSSDILAKNIMELEQDRRKMDLFGSNAGIMVAEYFSRNVQLGKINKIFNS